MPIFLVVEDEEKLLESPRRGLSDEEYEVLAALTGGLLEKGPSIWH